MYSCIIDRRQAQSFFGDDIGAEPLSVALLPLESIISQRRADEALQTLAANAPSCIDLILRPNERKIKEEQKESYEFHRELGEFCSEFGLNPSQSTAVLAAANLSEDEPLLLVRGPPGTGKTSLAAALLSMLCSIPPQSPLFVRGAQDLQRVLCSAGTNAAVRTVARRFLAKFIGSQAKPQFSERIDRPDARLSLSSIILVGVEKEIEPFGLEKEKELEDESAEAAQQRIDEHAEDEQEDILEDLEEGVAPGEESDDEDSSDSDEEEGEERKSNDRRARLAARATDDYGLSTIFLDHRVRRLHLLFHALRKTLLKWRDSKEKGLANIADASFLPFLLKRVEAKRQLTLSDAASLCLVTAQGWLKDAALAVVAVEGSFDLPPLGPSGDLIKLTARNGRDELLRQWKNIESSLADLVRRLSDYQRVLSTNPSRAVQPIEVTATESEVLEGLMDLTQLRSDMRRHVSAITEIVDIWQASLSFLPRIHEVLVSQARLVFATVSCAARASIVAAERMLRGLHAMRKRWNVPPEVLVLQPILSVLIDEAAQLVESFVPIAFFPSVTRLFFIGDTKQLKPRSSAMCWSGRGMRARCTSALNRTGGPTTCCRLSTECIRPSPSGPTTDSTTDRSATTSR